MAKPTAGKRAFEAIGRSAQSRGVPMLIGRLERRTWPKWAQQAWARGYLAQIPHASGKGGVSL